MTCTRTALAAFCICTIALGACLPKVSAGADTAKPFADNFDRAALGDHFKKRGGTWTIQNGALHSRGEENIPLWLDVDLGVNTRVEFDAWSESKAVDTKVEIFGDGLRHESGYIVILGGWNNTITTIARLDEHEKTRVEKRTKWEAKKKYHWRVERTDGKTVKLFIDDELVVEYADKQPLVGPKNNRLGFTNWKSRVFYDNLKITPLP